MTAAQLLAERMDRGSTPASAQQPGPLRPGTTGSGRNSGSGAGGTGSAAGGGFDWCAEQLRASGHPQLAAEVLLSKAGRFLAGRDVASATAVFKDFENKESRLRWAHTSGRGGALGADARCGKGLAGTWLGSAVLNYCTQGLPFVVAPFMGSSRHQAVPQNHPAPPTRSRQGRQPLEVNRVPTRTRPPCPFQGACGHQPVVPVPAGGRPGGRGGVHRPGAEDGQVRGKGDDAHASMLYARPGGRRAGATRSECVFQEGRVVKDAPHTIAMAVSVHLHCEQHLRSSVHRRAATTYPLSNRQQKSHGL